MSRKPDLTYRECGMFVAFMPETDAGKHPWQIIANGTDGTGKVLAPCARQTIADLRRSGYVVHKAKPVTMSDDELLAALNT